MDLYWILSIFISKVSPLSINNNTNTFLGSRCDDSMKFYSNSVILCNAIPHQSRTKRSTNEKVISFRDTGNGSSLHIWSPLLHRGLSCPHQRTTERLMKNSQPAKGSSGALTHTCIYILSTRHTHNPGSDQLLSRTMPVCIAKMYTTVKVNYLKNDIELVL